MQILIGVRRLIALVGRGIDQSLGYLTSVAFGEEDGRRRRTRFLREPNPPKIFKGYGLTKGPTGPTTNNIYKNRTGFSVKKFICTNLVFLSAFALSCSVH